MMTTNNSGEESNTTDEPETTATIETSDSAAARPAVVADDDDDVDADNAVSDHPTDAAPAESNTPTPTTTSTPTPVTPNTPRTAAAADTPAASEKTKTDAVVVVKTEGNGDGVVVDERSADAVKLKFIFANRDGLTVVLPCKITDSIGEVKGFLMSMWPESLSPCAEGDRIRLICMGKGILMPDSKSLAACEVPVFKTHATPINVSVRPTNVAASHPKASKAGGLLSSSSSSGGVDDGRRDVGGARGEGGVSQGCSCVVL